MLLTEMNKPEEGREGPAELEGEEREVPQAHSMGRLLGGPQEQASICSPNATRVCSVPKDNTMRWLSNKYRKNSQGRTW